MTTVYVSIVKRDAGKPLGQPQIITVDVEGVDEEELLEDLMSDPDIINISSEVETASGTEAIEEVAKAVRDVAFGVETEMIVGRHRADGQNDEDTDWCVTLK
ncbi:hypothetical protein I5U59_04870 [Stenotrophomonas maltophilia]|nr:hypothetical protein [Stenotrophomonas maltophilia]MBH1502404.1 hypothetical protein [Stenotrophomonas maltophilia]